MRMLIVDVFFVDLLDFSHLCSGTFGLFDAFLSQLGHCFFLLLLRQSFLLLPVLSFPHVGSVMGFV